MIDFGSDVDVIVKRSRRKSVAIHVENQTVEIRAPHTTASWFIYDFLDEKKSWILKKLKEQKQKSSEILCIKHGQALSFLGTEITLNMVTAKTNRASLKNAILTLSVSDDEQATKVKLMDRWLLRQAQKELPDLIMLLAKELQLKHKISQIKFRKTKTKWGHCTHAGVIQLNPLIMLAPEFVLHYLIVHELCHLVHQNHSKDYWNMVSSVLPSYKEAELWLKQKGHQIWYC